MDKKITIIEFHQGITTSAYTFEEKVMMAFRQKIPATKTIEITKLFILLYNCSTCRPTQAISINDYIDLVNLRNGSKDSFDFIEKIDIRLLK